jgi:hypothetical protein
MQSYSQALPTAPLTSLDLRAPALPDRERRAPAKRLARALAKIASDARKAPERFLDTSRVREGGE